MKGRNLLFDLMSEPPQFRESSHGACTVTLILSSGLRVENVVLAWGAEIVKVEGRPVTLKSDLQFALADVKDVVAFR